MKYVYALLVCAFSLAVYASQRAVTDEGEIVILNDDGTWVFENPAAEEAVEISTNRRKFTKPRSSTFKLKSKRNNSQIWLDSKKWAIEKATPDEDTEYNFRLRGSDLYGQLITEQVVIDIEHLTQIALENARAAAPNMRITEREYRVVNGVKVIHMEMRGTVQGTDFTFSGYYHSNDTGTTQFLAYTGTSLVERYAEDIQDFLNGFSNQ